MLNSVSRRSRTSLVAMIVGGLLALAPVFGPLAMTLHYLDDFIAERPQPMRAPDISFFAELLALIVCPIGCSSLPYRWFYLFEVAAEPRPDPMPSFGVIRSLVCSHARSLILYLVTPSPMDGHGN